MREKLFECLKKLAAAFSRAIRTERPRCNPVLWRHELQTKKSDWKRPGLFLFIKRTLRACAVRCYG